MDPLKWPLLTKRNQFQIHLNDKINPHINEIVFALLCYNHTRQRAHKCETGKRTRLHWRKVNGKNIFNKNDWNLVSIVSIMAINFCLLWSLNRIDCYWVRWRTRKRILTDLCNNIQNTFELELLSTASL